MILQKFKILLKISDIFAMFYTQQPIKEMLWRIICKSGKAIEVVEYLMEKINEICIEIVPKRNKKGKKNNKRNKKSLKQN